MSEENTAGQALERIEEPPLPAPSAAEARAEQSAKSLQLGDRGVTFTNVDQALKYATACFNSRLLPQHIKTPQAAFVIMDNGRELGLRPWAAWKLIYITKQGRIAIMSKGALAVAQASPRFENYEEGIQLEGTEEMCAVATAKAKGHKPVEKRFSMADAKTAGLLEKRGEYNGPWQSYVKDMLLARARDRALSIAFAAELAGVEMETIAEDADRLEAGARGQKVEPVGPPREEAVVPRPALPEGQPVDPLVAMALKRAGQPVPSAARPSAPPPSEPAPETAPAATAARTTAGGPPAVPEPAEREEIARSVDEALPKPKKSRSARAKMKVGDIFEFGKSLRRVVEVDEDGHPVEIERLSDGDAAAYLAQKAAGVSSPKVDPPAPSGTSDKKCPRAHCGKPLNLLGDCDACGWPHARFE